MLQKICPVPFVPEDLCPPEEQHGLTERLRRSYISPNYLNRIHLKGSVTAYDGESLRHTLSND